MTTATTTMTMDMRQMGPPAAPRSSLEELVDQLMAALTFVETPTPVRVAPVGAPVDDAAAQPRLSLEEHVDRLMSALTFVEEPPAYSQDSQGIETAPTPRQRPVQRAIHEARRLRQSGDLDNALHTLAETELEPVESRLGRWAYSEWRHLVRRRYGEANLLVYSQGTGRAAALAPRHKGALEVVAVLGMKWRPGKLVSRRSLRGLRPLPRGGASC